MFFKTKKIEHFLSYHNGDGHPEETMMSKLCQYYKLSQWDSFRTIYYYALCYNLVDPFRMIKASEPIPHGDIDFVSDRRWVGQVPSRYYRMLTELTKDKFYALKGARSTQTQYEEVCQWYYFGRYAAYMFLECWNYLYPATIDDFIPAWEADELYTKGAVDLIGGSYDKKALNEFMKWCKSVTGDTAFSIETSLCGWAKIKKGTRYNGYYTERMLSYVSGTNMASAVYKLL